MLKGTGVGRKGKAVIMRIWRRDRRAVQVKMKVNGSKLRMLARSFPFLNRCVKICVSRKEKEFVVEGRFIRVCVRFKKGWVLLKLETS